jgi:hypothetical protein
VSPSRDPHQPESSEPRSAAADDEPSTSQALGDDAEAAATGHQEEAEDAGPGCLPGLLAAGALLLMAMFICCGVSTWYLYQQRTELAVRTLRGSVIPEMEQSNLAPEEKRAVIESLQQVIQLAEAGELEDWQASGIMERLNRAPLFEWGDLQTVEALIEQRESLDAETKAEARLQFSRLRRAAELGKVTAVDFARDILEHVYRDSDNQRERPKLQRDASDEDLRLVIAEAERAANRAGVDDEEFQVTLADLVRGEIAAGLEEGGL